MVDLRPLTLIEVGELAELEGMSPSDVPESFIDRLFSETEGNPFLSWSIYTPCKYPATEWNGLCPPVCGIC
jgi:hypothetical protein